MTVPNATAAALYAGGVADAPEPITGTMHITLDDADVLKLAEALGVDVEQIIADTPEED